LKRKDKVERQKGLKRGALEQEGQGRETRKASNGRKDKVKRQKGKDWREGLLKRKDKAERQGRPGMGGKTR
jgi:hypothetical protein